MHCRFLLSLYSVLRHLYIRYKAEKGRKQVGASETRGGDLMLYKITYADGRCHNYANSRKDLMEWLAILKDEVITEIKKIAKNGKSEIVTDRYQKYIRR